MIRRLRILILDIILNILYHRQQRLLRRTNRLYRRRQRLFDICTALYARRQQLLNK